MTRRFDLEAHLASEHKKTPLSQYLREIVYGGNDGIVTTFAVVAGFAGAQQNPASAVPLMSVLLFGLANLFADGLSMSLGSFLSLRANQDVYRSEKEKELHEITTDPENEMAETVEILRRHNFTTKQATTIAALYRLNPQYWVEFMMKDELQMQDPVGEKPFYVALFTFISFAFFGVIPLAPYILLPNNTALFPLSVVSTLGALILLGSLRAVITTQGAFRAIAETAFVGGISATAAYMVGTLFQI